MPVSITEDSFNFIRFGKTFQLRIETPGDMKRAVQLDEAHWVAVDAPVRTINLDADFLSLIDDDGDGRIRSEDVKKAVNWLLAQMKSTDGIRAGNTTLMLDAVDAGTAEGQKIVRSARKILRRLHGKDKNSERTKISLADVRKITELEKQGGLGEAGLILPDSTGDEQLRTFIEDILKTVGGENHPNDAPSVTTAKLEQFLGETREYLQWLARIDGEEAHLLNPIRPLFKESTKAYDLYLEMKDKLDHYFSLCNIVYLNPSLIQNDKPFWEESNLQDVAFRSADEIEKYLADAPLAWPAADCVLDFSGKTNPLYTEKLQELRDQLFAQILGSPPAELSQQQWKTIKSRFAPHQNWLDEKPDVKVDRLSEQTLRRYVDDPVYEKELRKLIRKSHRTAIVLANVRLVKKLILFQANLIDLLNSFVSFPDLYDPSSRALFEMGTLIMDGRHFTLSTRVLDREQHASFSNASNMHMLYVEVSDKQNEVLYEVAVPVTSGGRGNLQVNKWGIFHDIDGNECHAKVVKIVENPISLREAIAAPFKRLGRAITTKLEDISSESSDKFAKLGSTTVEQAGTTLQGGTPKPAPSAAGFLAGGGIAVAAIGSSAAFITKTLAGMNILTVLGTILGVLIAVLLPTTIVAYLKLRRRDLSCILEGSGWGINARMRLTREQARTFTLVPPYPDNSKGIRRTRIWFWLLLITLVAVAFWWYAAA